MKNRSLSVWLGLAALLVALGAAPTYTALYLTGSSSGTATIQPPAAAGTPILTLPTATGTLATRTGSVTTDHCAKFDSSGRIIDAGGACGTFAAPDRTVTSCGSCTVLAADMGGQINYNGSSLTAVIPAISGTVLAAGMQIVLTNQHSTALTISTTPTLNGFSGSTIPQYGGLACTSNGTSLDCLALGTAGGSGTVTTTGSPTSGDLVKFSGSSSITNTGSGLTYDGTSVLSLGVAGASVGGVALKNATSGTVTISPVSGALGTVTLSAPARTATLATTSGTLTSGDCAQFDGSGNLTAAGAACGSGGGTGDVVGPGSSTAGHFAIFDGTTGKLLKDTLAAPGTAAVVNTGTSGATIPLNNANNTVSGNNTYSGVSTYTGSLVVPIRVITAAGAVTVSATTDYMICVNKTSGAATTVNLPGSPATGLTFLIKDCKADAATNNITVTPASGNIDGAGTYVISTNRGAIAVVYSGAEWLVN